MHPLPLHKLAPFLASQSFESTFPHLETTSSTEVTIKTCGSNKADSITKKVDVLTNEADDTKVDDALSCARGTKRKHALSDEEKLAVRAERQQKRINHQRQAWKHLESRDIDALIVATK